MNQTQDHDTDSEFSVQPDDLAIVVKPDGTIRTIVGKREISEIGQAATGISLDDSGFSDQAKTFMSMVVTSACEPLKKAALDLISDKNVVNFNRLSNEGSVH